MNVRLAEAKDFSDLRLFYNRVASYMEDTRIDIFWRPNEYPSDDFLVDSIYHEDIILIEDERGIVASTIVNNIFDQAYGDVQWPSQIPSEHADAIHAFCVHPFARKEGLGHQLLWCACEYARNSGQEAIRAAVPGENKQALRLALSGGFNTTYTVSRHQAGKVLYFHLMERIF